MNRITTLCSLAILVLGACSKEKVRGLDMPELRLTAGIEAMTRATADNNAWTGGEQVAVEATSSTGGIQSEVKIYTAAADGTLTTDIPFGWTRDDERKRFRAWYCADGSSVAGGANATAAPDKWLSRPTSVVKAMHRAICSSPRLRLVIRTMLPILCR